MRDKSFKECEALNSLEEILSLDSHFGWSGSTSASASGHSHGHQTAITVTPPYSAANQGFCEVSSSPDSCYYSDRSRAASGDEPLSPGAPICEEFRPLPSLTDAMTAIDGAVPTSRQDCRIFIDLSSTDFLDPSICDLFLDPSGQHDKETNLNFEPEGEDPSWTYLESVPTTYHNYMKTEEDQIQEVLVSRGDILRSYVNIPHVQQWQQEPHVVVQVPPTQWQPGDPDPSFVVLGESKASIRHLSAPVGIPSPVSVQIERRNESAEEFIVKQKRQGRRQRPDVEVRLCHVCGERAGRHSYYGGQVCPSCRAFFRRSVQSKYSDSYKCTKEGRCEIGLKTRKNCQYCRFKLCEQAGMRRSWVLADGERKRLTAMKGRKNSFSPSASPETTLTNLLMLEKDESDKIQDCLDKITMIRNQTEDMNPDAMEEIALILKERSQQISGECRTALKKVLEQRTRLFALNIPEYTLLSSHDQIMLLEENKGPLIALRVATFFHTEVNWRQQIGMILGHGDFTRLTQSLSGLQLSEDRQLKYEQFFAPPTANCEAMPHPGSPPYVSSYLAVDEAAAQKEHKRLLKKISHWVEDDTMFCLMNLIILFCTDQTSQMKERHRCDSFQTYFSNLLFRYLLSRHHPAEARVKFAEGIQVVSYCRELNTLAAKAKLCCKDQEDESC